MKREPGLHVTKSVLIRSLQDIFPESIDSVGIANLIFDKCRGKSCHNRSLFISDKMVNEKVNRVLVSGADDTSLFSTLLVTCRRQLHHKGISQIKPMSKDWLVMKEITSKAVQFCEDFKLRRREGFIAYINIGLSRIVKFNLNRLNGMGEIISLIYEAEVELKNDTTPLVTDEIYKYYNLKVVERAGLPMDYSKYPEKMVYFFRLKNESRGLKVSWKTYIDAQFKAFEYNNSIPEPTQMVGDKGKNRLAKFLFNGDREEIVENVSRDWKKILNNK